MSRSNQETRKPVLLIIPVVSNGTEEHTSNRMMNTAAIAFDGRQRRLLGILLVQPLCNTAHQFGNIIATCILRAILELMQLEDHDIINCSLHAYHAIKLMGVVWLGLINLLLEVGDKPSKFLQGICTARITKRQCQHATEVIWHKKLLYLRLRCSISSSPRPSNSASGSSPLWQSSCLSAFVTNNLIGSNSETILGIPRPRVLSLGHRIRIYVV